MVAVEQVGTNLKFNVETVLVPINAMIMDDRLLLKKEGLTSGDVSDSIMIGGLYHEFFRDKISISIPNLDLK